MSATITGSSASNNAPNDLLRRQSGNQKESDAHLMVGAAYVDFHAATIAVGVNRHTMEPKVIDVLRVLAEAAGEVVTRETLVDKVWDAPFGGDERLSRAISLLRKALGDERGRHQHIETIPKRGYKLIAPVRFIKERPPIASHEPPPEVMGSQLSAPENSIAVLPFVDMSAAKDQDHLADGLAEEILNALTKTQTLKVSGRTSSFAFKGKNKNMCAIAATLNVAYVLEGSLRMQGNKVRVTAQLIKADGFHLWSEIYDREMDDIFKLQEEIAQSIMRELTGLLNRSDSVPPKRLAPALTTSAESYALFTQGRDLTHNLNGQTTIPAGIDLLKRAVAIDPQFTDAWAWLALAHFILPEFSRTTQWESHFGHSCEAVARALDIDPDCSMALLVKAMQTAYELKLDKAISLYEQALQVDPNNIETMAGYGLGMLAIGRHDIAQPYFDQVVTQDPLCGIWHTTYGGLLLMAGDFDRSESCFRRSFDLGFGAAAFGVAHRMAQRGEVKDAIRFMGENFDGFAPVEQAELRSPLARRLMYNAYLRVAPVSRAIVAAAMKQRLANRKAQPTAASVISFLFLEEPGAFLRSILEKPNPYIGYTIARIWEPTEQSRRVREHRDFPAFVEAVGLKRAWGQHGEPMILARDHGSQSVNENVA